MKKGLIQVDNYKLYVHITPNNKKYFGITSQKEVDSRWDNGNGYKHQILFFRAIQKYGWDNIRHLVLVENLSKNWVCKLEQHFIWKYQANNPKFGYNMTIGGEGVNGYHLTPTQIETRRRNSTGRHHTEDTKRKLSEIAKNRHYTDEQKRIISQKLSKAHKGKPANNKGKKMSKEFCQQVSKRMKGTAHHTQSHSDETKRKISEHSKGKIVSQDTREKLRQRALDQWKRVREQKQQESEVI